MEWYKICKVKNADRIVSVIYCAAAGHGLEASDSGRIRLFSREAGQLPSSSRLVSQ